ncbi:MAG: TetR/AcrR family transcriptional regulator [Alloprevotella sp.]|nr:TetR/AcrR family transcriptional regulator [Alloprevotella sp.]
METRDRIIHEACKLFFQKGIKAVRMDDISQSLHISKRTLYQIFPDKKSLLMSCLRTAYEESWRERRAIVRGVDDVLEVALRVTRQQASKIKTLSSVFLMEVSQHPDIREYFDKLQNENVKEAMEFISKGVQQGYFRPEINHQVAQRTLQLGLDALKGSDLFRKCSPFDIFKSTFLVMLRGSLTEKGFKRLSEVENDILSA